MLFLGNCLEIMKELPDASIDLILCDPPYGTTQCKWDTIISFDQLWKELKRIRKNNAPSVLFGSEPFSSTLHLSNIDEFKYDWIWEKERGSGHLNAKKMPMKSHEIISVFYQTQPTYIPQGTILGNFNNDRPAKGKSKPSDLFGKEKNIGASSVGNYPLSVLKFSKDSYGKNNFHPTQKPIALLEYLINTYTKENEVILDFTMGSGSTGVACAKTNRKFIGIELDEKYFKIAEQRIADASKLKEVA